MKTKKQAKRSSAQSTPAKTSQKTTESQLGSNLQLNDGWERFWFSPQSYASLRLVRIGVALAVAWFAVSYFGEIGGWFAKDGMLNSDRLGRLVTSTGVESLAKWQFSLLYFLESPALLNGFLILLLVVASCVGFGVGGRVMIALLWMGFLSLANRQWVLVGSAEFLIASTIPCLLIAGTTSAGKPNEQRDDWKYGLATRLLQVQAILFLTVAIAAKIYHGTMAETAAGLGFDDAILGLPALGLVMLLMGPRLRKPAVLMIWVYCLTVGILDGSGLLALSWGTLFVIFWPTQDRS